MNGFQLWSSLAACHFVVLIFVWNCSVEFHPNEPVTHFWFILSIYSIHKVSYKTVLKFKLFIKQSGLFMQISLFIPQASSLGCVYDFWMGQAPVGLNISAVLFPYYNTRCCIFCLPQVFELQQYRCSTSALQNRTVCKGYLIGIDVDCVPLRLSWSIFQNTPFP